MLREIARSYETAVAEIKNFAKPEEVKQKERENVNRLLKKSSAGRFANFDKPKSHNQKKCFRCGKTGHRAKNLNCPARNREYFKCNKTGHYVRCCKTKLALNKNKEFNSKSQSVKARFHYERGKKHSLFVLLIFFCARFNFNRSLQSKMNKRDKECFFPRS